MEVEIVEHMRNANVENCPFVRSLLFALQATRR